MGLTRLEVSASVGSPGPTRTQPRGPSGEGPGLPLWSRFRLRSCSDAGEGQGVEGTLSPHCPTM